MDIIKFLNPTSPTKMEYGEIVNGLTSKMWIERYRLAGEFSFTGSVSEGIRENLPIGSLISHTNTTEIMIVEDHEINDNQGEDPKITVTGRSFETFLENRVVRGDQASFPSIDTTIDFNLGIDWTWVQAFALIIRTCLPTDLYDDNYAIPYLAVIAELGGSGGAVSRYLRRGEVYGALLNLLEFDNLGIKSVRPGPWSPLEPGYSHVAKLYSPYTSADIALVIHRGVDRTPGQIGAVIFAQDTGEIINADYLWSIQKKKNAALVTGRWVEVVVNPDSSITGYNRRMIYVDASDVDSSFSAMPTGTDYTNVVAALQQRGVDVLNSLNDVALTKAETAIDAVRYRYRVDYNVGDLVLVQGEYNENAKMRILEYVEIEDENGETGYPTFTIDLGS